MMSDYFRTAPGCSRGYCVFPRNREGKKGSVSDVRALCVTMKGPNEGGWLEDGLRCEQSAFRPHGEGLPGERISGACHFLDPVSGTGENGARAARESRRAGSESGHDFRSSLGRGPVPLGSRLCARFNRSLHGRRASVSRVSREGSDSVRIAAPSPRSLHAQCPAFSPPIRSS